MRQVLVVISYVSRRTSCLCLPRTVCMYTRQTVLSYEGWPPRFLLAEASNDSTLLSHPQKINIRDWRTGANPHSREIRMESLTRLRDAFAFRWHV